jgi:outer membrane protein assembly factor BamB
VILAPGGKEALMVNLEGETGKEQWRTPNPHGWQMTHSSIMPMDLEGERMYVYCASKGVAAASAKDGSILWETGDWKISLATVPSPLVLDRGRIFLTGGYNAGSMMLQVQKENGRFAVRSLFKLAPEVFGATQHTPIVYENHIYGTRADGKFVCLDFEGKVLWTSSGGVNLGLGSFIMGDGVIFAMNDSGHLRLCEASPALAGGRLIVRDLTRMICLEVGVGSTANVR